MKYILLIIAAFSLMACDDSSSPKASAQPETVPDEQSESALATAGLIPESKMVTLSAPNAQELPKELFVPLVN